MESEPEVKKETSERPQKPDHDAYPSLPGTPEPHITEVNVKQTKRQSLPPELTPRKSSKNEMEGISKSATIAGLASYTTPVADSGTFQHPQTEHLKVSSNESNLKKYFLLHIHRQSVSIPGEGRLRWITQFPGGKRGVSRHQKSRRGGGR